LELQLRWQSRVVIANLGCCDVVCGSSGGGDGGIFRVNECEDTTNLFTYDGTESYRVVFMRAGLRITRNAVSL
jgi:hypothetical protein